MSRQVMLSYSRKDGTFVHNFHEELVAHNIQTWADWKDIPPGFSWRQALYDGVLESDAMIIFLSANYLASEMCRMEFYLACFNNKQIIPIVLGDAWEEIGYAASKYNDLKPLIDLTWLAYGSGWCTKPFNDDQERFQALLKVINQDFTPIPPGPVFIAYNRNQVRFAEKIAKDLQAANIPVWMVTMLDIGTSWLECCHQALRQAKAIVPILDVEFSTNEILRNQILIARTRYLPMFPVITQEVAQSSDQDRSLRQALDESYEMRLLNELQWLMPNPDYDTMLQKLVNELNRTLNIE